MVACICLDGKALGPPLIFQRANGAVQSSWVDAIQAGEHSVFVTASPSSWSNNDIGLAWLKQVFERETRRHAPTGYRLLLLDGHESQVTMDFINHKKIVLAVFPPHPTHTLQPLDVKMFKPLSNAYSTDLARYLQDSQGLLNLDNETSSRSSGGLRVTYSNLHPSRGLLKPLVYSQTLYSRSLPRKTSNL